MFNASLVLKSHIWMVDICLDTFISPLSASWFFLRYVIFMFSSNNTTDFISNFKVTIFSSCLAVEISRGVHFTLAEN